MTAIRYHRGRTLTLASTFFLVIPPKFHAVVHFVSRLVGQQRLPDDHAYALLPRSQLVATTLGWHACNCLSPCPTAVSLR
ncbi:hypothetical protein PYCCODRAFT_1436849 [Trametes coccinea BRFM310]|uniref:Uncharacterized protein n=1 Tax=Trametes coccinea (strain BRFM310) TaxID=1353009 RepID=A0A1Y2IIR9_TRAC3|nr:hypothetical protein PYCCODRAFT_1436849 [Trametes coccinea BRFM310]